MRVLLLLALAMPLHAQAIRFEAPHRDCNLAEYKVDGPHNRWTLRRYEWHALNAGLSTLTAETLHRTTHIPRWAAAATAALAIGLLPHTINGVVRRVYAINPADWAFDLFNDSAPLLLWTGSSGGTWQSKTLALTTEVSGYAALSCYASP